MRWALRMLTDVSQDCGSRQGLSLDIANEDVTLRASCFPTYRRGLFWSRELGSLCPCRVYTYLSPLPGLGVPLSHPPG